MAHRNKSNTSSTPRVEILANIQTYAAKVTSTEQESPSTTDIAAAEARLEQTLAELRSRVEKERTARDQLRKDAATRQSAARRRSRDVSSAGGLHSVDGPSADPSTRLRQIRAVTTAYRELAEREPVMPNPYSALPALLALQATARENALVQRSVAETHAELKAARARLAAEMADERDNEALRDALVARVAALRDAQASARSQSARQTAEDAARKRLAAAEAQELASRAQARYHSRELVGFIQTRIAPMLAAEELGGPVAGSEPGITEDDVLAGFTAHGRVKKTKSKDAGSSEQSTERRQQLRQQRIDAIWGPVAGADAFAADEDALSQTEVQAANLEMRNLAQALLDAASQRNGSNPYVRLARDSAAARFLVRANVAHLHRTDARRIRLQEFGREADD